MSDRPTRGELETRAAPDLTVDGRRLRGVIPYGIESRDLGGWREQIARGALDGTSMDDLVATVDHGGVPLARFPTTLDVESRDDGLHWSLALPESRSDVREAVERGDLRETSWRMIVAKDRWEGDVRHVEQIAELRDVSIVTTAAYPAAKAEFRNSEAADARQKEDESMSENTETAEAVQTADAAEERQAPEPATEGNLTVEDRTAGPAPIEERWESEIRSVRVGEARALTTSSASAVAPAEASTLLWDKLRASSVMLASGVRVITTDRESLEIPKVSTDVSPGFVAEGADITAGDPGFATLTATPQKIAHLVQLSNEVIDDSNPSIVDAVNQNVTVALGLKLDSALIEGAQSSGLGIKGMKNVSSIQSIDLGTNGAALTNYDQVINAVGKLQDKNVPGPYAAVAHPRTWTELALLKRQDSNNEQLSPPREMPTPFSSTQVSIAETKGTATDASSVYVFAPAQLVLVRRLDITVEIDRSRLFNSDESEIRGKLRADLLVPDPNAIVRITGVIPPSAS